MLQVIPSSGSLLSPTAPVAGLAGLPILRTPRLKFPRRGLGAGSQTGEEIGATITSIAGATGPAAPIVAAVGTLVSLVSSFVGGGCGQACIASSQAEQIYEYAGQCLDAVAAAGMLGQNDLLTGLEDMLNAGVQHMQQLQSQGDAKAAAGLTNLQKTLQMDISGASQYPATAPKALDLAQAQAVFPGTSGWYAGSASAGAQLAVAYLQSLQSVSSGLLGSLGSGSVTILGTTVPTSTLLIGLALLGGGIYFMRE